MKCITKQHLSDLLDRINYLLNRSINTFELKGRNGFIYMDYCDGSKDSLFNTSITKREMYNSMKAFEMGLYFNIDK